MDGTPGGAPSRVERRTPFVQILRTTPVRTVCPNFYVLLHANGCAYEPACDDCNLRSTLWYLEAPRVFTNVDDLVGDVRAWIARDGLARYPQADRIRMYREAIEALSDHSSVGLCEETADVWTAVGLDSEAKTCNCAT